MMPFSIVDRAIVVLTLKDLNFSHCVRISIPVYEKVSCLRYLLFHFNFAQVKLASFDYFNFGSKRNLSLHIFILKLFIRVKLSLFFLQLTHMMILIWKRNLTYTNSIIHLFSVAQIIFLYPSVLYSCTSFIFLFKILEGVILIDFKGVILVILLSYYCSFREFLFNVFYLKLKKFLKI